MSRRIRAAVWVALLLAGGVALLAGCSERKASSSPGPPPGVPVTAATVVQKDVPVQVRPIGNVQAYSTVTVMSQVDGQVLHIHFAEGQEVHTGDPLFTLDQRPFRAALHQAQGNLGRDQAQLQQVEAALAQSRAAAKQAEANLTRDEVQLDNAKIEDRRYKELIDDGAISKEQYDQVHTAGLAQQATVEGDGAAVANAQAAIRAAEATVANVRAAIRADQAAVESSRIQLGYTMIRAPLEGRTGSLLVHAGSTVKARDAGSALVVIDQIRPISVAFAVPEQYLADIKRYRAAGTIRVEAFVPGQDQTPEQGRLTFVNNTVDPATGTIQLKAVFPNPGSRLWPGQFLNVVLTLTTEPDATVVPSQAIQSGQQGPYVFVIKPDLTLEARPVVLGLAVGNHTVIQKGVDPGERVVTEGQIRLVPGARVKIKASIPAPAAEAIS